MKGILYGVGVGPGDPELLTIKAVKIIEKCNVIVTPQTSEEKTFALDIVEGVCDLSDKTIIKTEFLMTRDSELLKKRHSDIANQIASHLDMGRDVAMLNLGDISVYSTFSYIMEILQTNGYECEMIPGITSFCAVASTLKTSLTTMHQPLHIFPAGNLEDIISEKGTKVIMKSGKQMPKVKEILKEKANGQFVQAVTNCGLSNQIIAKTLEEIPDDASYFTTIIVKD